MKKESPINDFNVNNPTEKNISFIFGDLLFNLIGAISFEPYKAYKKDYEEILQKVKGWIYIYVNTKILENIDLKEMDEVFDKVLTLKDELFLGDEWFQEIIQQDVESLKLLRFNEIFNKKGK